VNSSCKEAEQAHRQGAATRAQMPALLKGLIYGPNGRATAATSRSRRCAAVARSPQAGAQGDTSCLATPAQPR
jgi:hypothetical protein